MNAIELKFDELIDEYATKEGVSSEDYFQSKVLPFIDAINNSWLWNPDLYLVEYRKSCGDLWNDVKNNPGLSDMIQKWVDKKIHIFLTCEVSKICALFDNKISVQEVTKELIQL